ncbi:MAG: ATP-binding protein [Acidobacteriota bacterium]
MAALQRQFTLRVPSSTENLALIRELVGGVGAQAGLDDSDIARLEMAVDEACANVIEHAYGNDSSKEVVVRATFDDEVLRIDVEDSGCGFQPPTIGRAPLGQLAAKRKSGGLGLQLIKSVMDEVHYEMEPGIKNELHMVKRIRKA